MDRVLREELDLVDGLADSSVIVLDPCCGTGVHLVEVLNKSSPPRSATRVATRWWPRISRKRNGTCVRF